jgi:hypothetical protein
MIRTLITLSIVYGAHAGSGSDPTGAPTYDPAGTPLPDKLSTGSLGSHLASTLRQFKQFNQLSGITPDATLEQINGMDYQKATAECDPQLGYLWTAPGGPSLARPLSLYYNQAGQIAGLRVDIFGASAAQGRMIEDGYYISAGSDHWFLSVSFRSPEEMCTEQMSSEQIGDRLVVNQDSIAKSIPMTSSEAEAEGFMPGSCMQSMGQHWMYDLVDAPSNSYISGNLLPVVPMYSNGKLNSFFFTTPTCQGPSHKGSSEPYSWDNTGPLGCALPSWAMCMNFCDGRCKTNALIGRENAWASSGTDHWGTMHIFFNADPANEPTCPGYSAFDAGGPAGIMFGRHCPANTAALTDLHFESSLERSSDNNNDAVVVVILLVVVGVIGVVGAAVWHKKQQKPLDFVEVEVLSHTGSGSCYDSCQ